MGAARPVDGVLAGEGPPERRRASPRPPTRGGSANAASRRCSARTPGTASPRRPARALRAEGVAFVVDMASEVEPPYDWAELRVPCLIGYGEKTWPCSVEASQRLAAIARLRDVRGGRARRTPPTPVTPRASPSSCAGPWRSRPVSGGTCSRVSACAVRGPAPRRLPPRRLRSPAASPILGPLLPRILARWRDFAPPGYKNRAFANSARFPRRVARISRHQDRPSRRSATKRVHVSALRRRPRPTRWPRRPRKPRTPGPARPPPE